MDNSAPDRDQKIGYVAFIGFIRLSCAKCQTEKNAVGLNKRLFLHRDLAGSKDDGAERCIFSMMV